MKEVNKEVLKDAANRLLFDMKDEEYDTLLNEFPHFSEFTHFSMALQKYPSE